ncbi:MAG: hypothetical protein JSS02_18580 [Planctomycetes bacterium]|nr:hypothetical protein [Planctomycetota bacterium]
MYWSTALLGGLLVVAVTWGLLYALTSGPFSFWNQVYRLGGTSGPATADWMGWMDRLGVTTPISATHISPRLFDIPLIWLIAGAILSVFRILLASVLDVDSTRTAIPPVDRVLARILALATIWTIAGGLWEAGIYLKKLELTAVATGGAAGGAGLFAWIRNWLTNASRIGDSGGRLPKFVRVLLVQLLAYATVGLVYIVAVSLSVQVLGPWPLRWQAAWGALIGIAIVGLQLIPSEFGLHVFYRNRITRAFLGASNPCTFNAARATFTASENRETDVRAWDDVYLHELHATGRPLHLVCCTANHLSGDQLGMLSRGGRSAVLSCQGVAVGDHWSAQSELTLGSALTASAAAFNSEMGSVSIVLGPAVSFLLSALNLRLGIWVVHPHYPETAPTWFPGLRFYEELFGMSDAADVAPSAEAPQPAIARHIHLSDGGHFENLALYELIRRHCRYIIVSDCGEDPQVRFEDFGNAVRRIREDFGVDIEIDLDPLRPDPQGRSRQHLVVGTIRFDPNGGDRDVGVLVYFKPTLTGDEPCDITNYRTLNPTFPHETTGDQFYDEAQWESYRRLGSHAAFEAFSMLDGGRAPEKYEVFAKVRERWYPTPAHLDDKLAALNGRFIEFEHRLADIAPVRFMAELFPELSTNLTPRTNRGPLQREEDTLAELHLLLEMIQIMEDIVLSVDFRKNFNNPLLLGWVNVFHRWAHADTFRAWWPILSPLYSPQLRKFAEERFDLADTKSNRTGAATIVVEFRPDQRPAEFDRRLHEVLKRSSLTGRETQATHRALFVLKLQQGTTQVQADVGLVQFTYVGADGGQPRIEWHDADFLIVPGLWGAGLGGAFLREFRLRLASEFPLLTRPRPLGPAGVLRVIIDLDRTKGTGFIHRDTGHRRERNDLLQFYKSHGFRPVGHEPHGQTTMRLDCSELLPSP